VHAGSERTGSIFLQKDISQQAIAPAQIEAGN
jgi:hypothetical protein